MNSTNEHEHAHISTNKWNPKTRQFQSTLCTRELSRLTLLLSAKPSLIEPDGDFIEGYKPKPFLDTVANLYMVKLTAIKQDTPQQVLVHVGHTITKMLNTRSMISSVCEANVMYILDRVIKTLGPLKGVKGNQINKVEDLLEEIIEKEVIIPAQTYERMKLATATMRCLHERT